MTTIPVSTRFRAQLAHAHGDARLRGVPFSPLSGERLTLNGRTYALELLETGGFLTESGRAKYTATLTDLSTGQRLEYAGLWARARRARDGRVRHSYSHPRVGTHRTWADFTRALLTHAAQIWGQGVAA